MKILFSEKIWEQITSLWRDKKNVDLDIADEQVKEMMNVWFVSRRSVVSDKKRKYDESRAWLNIDGRTRQRGYRKIRSLLKYAAVFVVGMLGMILWLDYRSGVKLSQISVESIEVISSGNQKAELILANGKKISLDTTMSAETAKLSEMKFVNNIENGKLSYQGDSVSEEAGFHTLNVPKGGEYILQLPDGSCVWLNSESSIRFPIRFAGNKREVFLSGEAYFKVAKNEKSPFQVYVKGGSVTVLGTSFNTI